VRRAILAILALALCSGCLDLNFDPPSIVKSPRILAMSADPPEALIGEDIHFEALLVDAQGDDLSAQADVEVEWVICLGLEAILDAANLANPATSSTEDCRPGSPSRIELAPDGAPNRAILPGEVLTEIAMMLPMGDPMMPIPDPGIPGVDPEVLRTLVAVIAEVGIPLEVRVVVRRDGEPILSGFKRFAITTRPDPTTNPPPPRFAVDGTEVSARDGDDPHACVTADGSAPVVAAGEAITLAPDENEEPWLETYPVFDIAGDVLMIEETAYYSWFSTGGGFDPEVSQRPERDSTWTTPEEPGTYPLFVVVRDGHLGISWCRVDVDVR